MSKVRSRLGGRVDYCPFPSRWFIVRYVYITPLGRDSGLRPGLRRAVIENSGEHGKQMFPIMSYPTTLGSCHACITKPSNLLLDPDTSKRSRLAPFLLSGSASRPTHPLRRRICPFDPNEIYQTLYRRPQTNCDWTRERPNFRKMEVHKVMIHARVSEFNGPWLLKLDV